MADEASTGPIPPYTSFATLLNQLQRMEREGVPSRIDPSYLVGMSGGTQSQFRVALRSLGLIDDEGHSTELLHRLASNPATRAEQLADILRSRFPRLVELNGNATRGELDDVLASYQLSTDTRRKAAAFYVAAATYAGFTLSPHIRPAKGVNSSGAQRRPRSGRRRGTPPARDVPPATPANDPAHMRREYFELLIQKAKEADEDNSDLLDRIERLIGIPASEKPMGEGMGDRTTAGSKPATPADPQ